LWQSRKTRTSIFISYAHADASEVAARLWQDLSREGFDVWFDRRRIAGGASWTTEIETALDGCDILLALLTAGSYASDLCRAEQLRGLRKGKRVIPLLVQPASEIPLHLESKNYQVFTGTKAYTDQLAILIGDIGRGASGVELKEDFRRTYVTAPPLPRNYVPRTEAITGLVSVLITDNVGPTIALTALEGMGGIGKTVLAQALCHEEAVQQAFPDGLVWVTLGKESARILKDQLREIGKALGDDLAGYDTETGCINSYRSIIRRKAALIVVDDVWKPSDLEPFRADSRRSRLLFTTRDSTIAAAVGAEEIITSLLTDEQARNVLARWCGLEPKEFPPEAEEIIRECGRLPLAVAMIGAMLHRKPLEYWTIVRDLLRTADLARISAQFPDYPHTDMLRVIQVSIEALAPRERERYIALAVLLDDMPATPVVQQTLWNASELDALQTAERFVSLSLAQRDTNHGGIRLHDLQLDYVRSQTPDPEALEVIHGAMRLSSTVILKDPSQFASQLTGRLLPHGRNPAIRCFTTHLARAAPRPWIRLLRSTLDPPGTGLIRTLEGHTAMVLRVLATPDGQRMVSGSADHTILVWDWETGRELHSLRGHTDGVGDLAVTSDGRLAVSGSWDKTLKLWDLKTGHEIRTLSGHSAAVHAVALTPDDRRVVSASRDRTLKLWDLETGREIRAFQGHGDSVENVAVMPDGRRVISGSADRTIRVWNLETGRAMNVLRDDSGRSRLAAFPDGVRAVSVAEGGKLKLWDPVTGREIRTLRGRSKGVSRVAIHPSGRQMLAGSDNTVKIWDLESGKEIRTLHGHFEAVNDVAVTRDGRYILAASSDHTAKVCYLQSGPILRLPQDHFDRVAEIAVSADGHSAVSGSGDKTLKIWNIAGPREKRTVRGHKEGVNSVTVTPDSRRIVSVSSDGSILITKLKSGRKLRRIERAHQFSAIWSVALSPDGRQAVTAAQDYTVKVWDLERTHVRAVLRGHFSAVRDVAVSPDSRFIVSASGDRTLKVWDFNTGRGVRTIPTPAQAAPEALALTADGNAICACEDGTLRIWELETGCLVQSLQAHSQRVESVALSHDDRLAASASRDRTIKIWNRGTNSMIASFSCDAPATCCAIAGSDIVLAGDAAGRVHFLKLEYADQQYRLPRHVRVLQMLQWLWRR
jgi:WD40 repeat protein